jgi:iron complex outermembrane receptor protein
MSVTRLRSLVLHWPAIGLALLLALTPTVSASAQNQIMKGSITGAVTDAQQLAVPGAMVEVSAEGREGRWTLVSDESGQFGAYGMEPGTYRIEARVSGFGAFQSGALTLRPGQNLALTVRLSPAGVTEQVLVTPDVIDRRTDYSSPANYITADQIASLNTATSEDIVAYQPGVVVRRRYIGDSNGTLGMRGANMFQTSRAMVFADGVPLHNPLQTRWNGAPRWSLVAPDEVASAEVVYGPFSAEYSGNAMGGVVKFNTKTPERRQLIFDGNLYGQTYSFGGANDTLGGGRSTLSFGDHVGRFSVSILHNHLQNASQPQNFALDASALPAATTQPVVTGAQETVNYRGADAVVYGDEGRDQVRSDLLKVKIGHQHSATWQSRWTVAYEDRNDRNQQAANYLRDASGAIVWGDGNNNTKDAAIGGRAFNVDNAFFGVSNRTRRSLFFAWDAEGRLGNDWLLEATASRFDILEDAVADSSFNPADPRNNGSGALTVFDNTRWTTLDLKLRDPDFLSRPNLTFVTGYHVSAQSIGVTQYSTSNYIDQTRDAVTNNSGGTTMIHALFGQLGWRVHPDVELTLGGRQELWQSRKGFAQTATLDLTHPDRDISAFSPKASIGWEPADRLRVQYSVARASRFPVVEELFDYQVRTYGSVLGDAELEPEEGLHHNIGFQQGLGDGHVEVNYFRDDVDNTIFTQSQVVGGRFIFSFLPIDKVRTNGLEIVLDQRRLGGSPIDLQVNATMTDAKIIRHALQPSIEGNVFPRMPKLRMGLFGVYHVSPAWMSSVGVRYTSDQFGDLDNGDTVDNVFGAMDGYVFVDLKVSRSLGGGNRISFGIDNLTDADAFVFHPWPGRTFFAELSVDVLGGWLGRN